MPSIEEIHSRNRARLLVGAVIGSVGDLIAVHVNPEGRALVPKVEPPLAGDIVGFDLSFAEAMEPPPA